MRKILNALVYFAVCLLSHPGCSATTADAFPPDGGQRSIVYTYPVYARSDQAFVLEVGVVGVDVSGVTALAFSNCPVGPTKPILSIDVRARNEANVLAMVGPNPTMVDVDCGTMTIPGTGLSITPSVYFLRP